MSEKGSGTPLLNELQNDGFKSNLQSQFSDPHGIKQITVREAAQQLVARHGPQQNFTPEPLLQHSPLGVNIPTYLSRFNEFIWSLGKLELFSGSMWINAVCRWAHWTLLFCFFSWSWYSKICLFMKWILKKKKKTMLSMFFGAVQFNSSFLDSHFLSWPQPFIIALYNNWYSISPEFSQRWRAVVSSFIISHPFSPHLSW